MDNQKYDAVVIGGGFFGCALALHLKKEKGFHVLLIEKDGDLLQRASYGNQARVHNGYHYPRSVITALRSRINFPQFVQDYKECIIDDFDKYYAIPFENSKVSASQFQAFCERIGAPIKEAPKKISNLCNPDMVEKVFSTKEYAFDAVILKNLVKNDLQNADVDILLDTLVNTLSQSRDGIEVHYTTNEHMQTVYATHVFNCTYSQINQVLRDSNLPMIYLKHELTEMALIEVPNEIKDIGITFMCGPFFSTMPFPSRNLHTLSHVRYTPHHYWHDTEALKYMNAHEYFSNIQKESKYEHMIRDVARYIPIMKESKYIDSIWEVKTILPQNEVDDGRPILFKKNHGLANLTCIMGGKIDNIYDVFAELYYLN